MMHSNSCVKPGWWLLAELGVFQKDSDVWFQSLQREAKAAIFIWSNSDGLQLLLLTSYPVSFEFALLPFQVLEFYCAFIRLSQHLQKAMLSELSLVFESVLLHILKLQNFVSGFGQHFCHCHPNLHVNSKSWNMKCLVLFFSYWMSKSRYSMRGVLLKLPQTAFSL